MYRSLMQPVKIVLNTTILRAIKVKPIFSKYFFRQESSTTHKFFLRMYFTYVLFAPDFNQIYIGQTQDLPTIYA